MLRDEEEAIARIIKKREKILETKYGNYSDNLNLVSRTLDSIAACFQLNGGTIDEITFPSLKMFEGIRNKDAKVIDSNIQLLRNESSKLPKHIRLSVDAQIELLNACCKNIINYELDMSGDKK